jgi:hypothetical protein
MSVGSYRIDHGIAPEQRFDGKNAAPSHNFRHLPCTCSRDMMRLANDFAMVTINHLIDDQSCTVYP